MAFFLAVKAPTEIVERRWTVPACGPANASLSASGITVDDYTFEGDDLVLTLSAGTAAATGSIVATVTMSDGQTLVETLYIPVAVSTSSAATAQDICTFALRKIEGDGETPDATRAAIALEFLSDMLEEWRVSGADIGATRPLTLSTVIYCPESYLSAVKNNLALRIHTHYEIPITPMTARLASSGLSHIKQTNLKGRDKVSPEPRDYY